MIEPALPTIVVFGSLIYGLGQKRLPDSLCLHLYPIMAVFLFFVFFPDKSTAIVNHLDARREG